MSETALDYLWGKENTTQFHLTKHTIEAPKGKRYWCDNKHHRIGALYQELGKCLQGWYQNTEQLCQTTL